MRSKETSILCYPNVDWNIDNHWKCWVSIGNWRIVAFGNADVWRAANAVEHRSGTTCTQKSEN